MVAEQVMATRNRTARSCGRRPHLPISPCQPQSSGRSCSTGCASARTTPSSRPGWLTRCVSLTPSILAGTCRRTPHEGGGAAGGSRGGEDARVSPSPARSPSSAPPAPSAGRRSRWPGRIRTGCGSPGWPPAAPTSPPLAEQALALGVRTVAVARATAAQDLQLAFYAAASKRGWAKGEYALPEILAGPRAAEELAARPGRRRPQRHHRLDRARPDAVGAEGRPHRRPGQQGVAGRRRRPRAPPPRHPDSSSRSTPSTRRSPSACAAAPAARSRGWCSPPAVARSAAGRPPSSPT